jgi:glyoxylase-like metal-dependent hydrolase (beta-lactamase superfamily II)/rhodanese-related sulfurtransferase
MSMIFEQFYLDCLSQASYLIGDTSSGRAVVVDPTRDVQQYLDSAKQHGLTIELVLETHFHADFLSGHLELANATGGVVGFGSVAQPEFSARLFADGERYSLGDVTLEIRHTPGHTPESISIVVFETATSTTPYGVLTGDTMFIGDVGRPDLLVSIGRTAEDLAKDLYSSLRTKLLTLPDETRVFPAHGAGSACGKNLSTETQSTIGEQRRDNYALQFNDVESFVAAVTEGQPPAPGYFAYDAQRNKQDRALLDEHTAPTQMSVPDAVAAHGRGVQLVDTRDSQFFATGHLRGSVNVGLQGRYAEYAGSVIRPDEEIVLITEPGYELEAKIRLGRIGYDRVVGWASVDELVEHPDLVDKASRLTPRQFADRTASVSNLQIVDVRGEGEYKVNHYDGATNIPVSQLNARLSELDPSRPAVVYCAGGYRSSIAASVLRSVGFSDVSDVLGGFEAMVQSQN